MSRMLCGARGNFFLETKVTKKNDFGNPGPGSREGARPKVEVAVEVADTTQT
jgi:hypothetical protein